jgi:transcriptional regulator with XRE-family HTH domain
MRDLSKFAEEIKAQRIALGPTQSALAEICQVTASYISKMENNQIPYPPAKDIIALLARALQLDEYKLTLMAGQIPAEMQKLFLSVLLAYPREKVQQILETAFLEAIF